MSRFREDEVSPLLTKVVEIGSGKEIVVRVVAVVEGEREGKGSTEEKM